MSAASSVRTKTRWLYARLAGACGVVEGAGPLPSEIGAGQHGGAAGKTVADLLEALVQWRPSMQPQSRPTPWSTTGVTPTRSCCWPGRGRRGSGDPGAGPSAQGVAPPSRTSQAGGRRPCPARGGQPGTAAVPLVVLLRAGGDAAALAPSPRRRGLDLPASWAGGDRRSTTTYSG